MHAYLEVENFSQKVEKITKHTLKLHKKSKNYTVSALNSEVIILIKMGYSFEMVQFLTIIAGLRLQNHLN